LFDGSVGIDATQTLIADTDKLNARIERLRVASHFKNAEMEGFFSPVSKRIDQ